VRLPPHARRARAVGAAVSRRRRLYRTCRIRRRNGVCAVNAAADCLMASRPSTTSSSWTPCCTKCLFQM
jgi:hypothetical protein